MRFKCVFKFCNSLVSESDFVDIHRCYSMTHPGRTNFLLHGVGVYYTVEQKKYGKDSDSFLQIERFNKIFDHAPAYSSSLNCINGLFCVWKPFSMQPAAIFNPSTRESEEKKFKVLMSAKHVKEGYVKYWVLTLGIDKHGEKTQSISPFTPSYSKPSVCISGVIYQFVISDNEYAITAFDVKSKQFEFSAFWKAIESVYHYEQIEVKEQTSRKEWERHIIFFPSIWNNREPASISSGTSVDGEIVFVTNLKSCALCLCYDFITKIWTNVEIKGLPTETYIKGICSYVETLVM
ncbi:hypothetical protein R3W88_024868 [Solanum pinnatisectum]|uniref:F-box associated beta-propeller type 3 domain-containing protein n=1 Tax=Solanum pinnatisectum TaxID=50273 RepID=A0AAV9M4H6_9SOLN|nr:hypothetical protein R3W88_024868 [Solanum pinnatisectum]